MQKKILVFCNGKSQFELLLAKEICTIDLETNYVMQNTSEDDLILIDRKIEHRLLLFERITNRSTLVNHKFIPTTEIGILEWYRRLIFKDKIFKNIPTNDEYNFSYLITSNTNDFLDSTYGHPIYNEEFTIYKNLSIHKPN